MNLGSVAARCVPLSSSYVTQKCVEVTDRIGKRNQRTQRPSFVRSVVINSDKWLKLLGWKVAKVRANFLHSELFFTLSPVQYIHHPQNIIKDSLASGCPAGMFGTGTRNRNETRKLQSAKTDRVPL